MATKSYSKHKEYKEFKSSGNVPYTDEQFDMLKSELIPAKSKLNSLDRNGAGAREYHYEYSEERHPTGKYDRKDLRTVEQYTVPPHSTPKSEHSSYYYEREERDLPAIKSATRTYNYDSSVGSTPGYTKVKSSKATKELSHNVEELDSLLDDLRQDQERSLYKSGYTSDTAESSSFDYRRGTPVKTPSSGYSTLKKEERIETSSWGSSPPPPPTVTRQEAIKQQMYREEKTESRVVPSQISPAIAHPVPAPVCASCHHAPSTTGTLSRSGTPMNKVTTTVKTYTYEVPADSDPAAAPLPPVPDHQHTYLSERQVNSTTSNTTLVPPSPSLGCQYCSHCNSRITRGVAQPPPPVTSHTYHSVESTDVTDRTNERIIYPKPANETKLVPSDPYPRGNNTYSPTHFKYSETTYSSQNTTERLPPPASPFPRPATPSQLEQQPPKRLDDLMADFPEARFPTQPDGLTQRNIKVTHESSTQAKAPPVGSSRNVAGPAVYYPPGHTPFQKKDDGWQTSAAMQGGGAYASGRGMYEYESGSKSKSKTTEKKTAVPICLPLCCAMPCVIM